VVIAIREGTRFLGDVLPATFPLDLPLLTEVYATVVGNIASTRLLAVGVLIILVMRFRPQGVLPPQRELIWPQSVADSSGPGETNPRETVTEDAAASAHADPDEGGETDE
jgi:branched-chain amino acid transport system permease protein